MNKGFSLIEIMLAMALSVILLGLLGETYLSIKKTYLAQEQQVQMQETYRLASYILRKNISTAGYAGCLASNFPTQAIRGYNSDNVPSYLQGKIAKDSDVIIISKADTNITQLTKDVIAPTTTVRVKKSPTTKKSDELLISDCSHAELFTKGELIQHDYKIADTEVAKYTETAYFIFDDALYTVVNQGYKRELVEGIKSMHITYQTATDFYAAAQITDWSKVLGVKITLTFLDDKSLPVYISLKERAL